MPYRRWWMALLLLASLDGAARGQAPLAWKFNQGETFYIEKTITQKQTLLLKGKTSKEEHTVSSLVRVRVKEVQAEDAILEWTTETVQLTSQPLGGAVGLDALLLEKMKGAVFLLTVGRTGQVRRFQGHETFLHKLTEGQPELAPMARALISEDSLKSPIANLFACLPARAVKRGERWQMPALEPLGLLGACQGVNEFTCQGEDQEGWRLSRQSRLSYLGAPANQDRLLKIVGGGLAAREATARLVFNAAQGRLVRADTLLKLQGTLTVEVVGQREDLEVAMTRTTAWRFLEKRPEKK